MHVTLLIISLYFLCSLAICDKREESASNSDAARGAELSPQPSPVSQTREKTSSADPVQPPTITRQAWKANDPVAEMTPHKPSRITIHHTAVMQKRDVSLERKMQSLQRFSQHPSELADGGKKPAWPDVPYHFYIDLLGQIAEGRNIAYVGDTNTDYDPTNHILIVLEGNFESEQPTNSQLKQLLNLTRWLSWKWQIPATEIKGHKDYAATACPGKNLESELPRLRMSLATKEER